MPSNVRRRSPKRGACGYARGEYGCREEAGHPAENLVLMSGVVDRQERSEQAEQAEHTASQQEEGYDPCHVLSLSSAVICRFHAD
jgi:hypothetical protein